MIRVDIGELVWLALAVLLGLGVVIAWIIKAEVSRNFFKVEIKKLKSQLGDAGREKMMMIEEMQAFKGAAGTSSGEQDPEGALSNKMMIGKMMERTEELEKENARLKRELNEAKSSLEEVYNALCSK